MIIKFMNSSFRFNATGISCCPENSRSRCVQPGEFPDTANGDLPMNVISSCPGAAALLFLACCISFVPPVTAACDDFIADFTYDLGTLPDGPPYTVTFTDASVPAAGQPLRSVGYQWGDGYSHASPVSESGTSASHSYARDGSFTVVMWATSTCGQSESTTKTITVECSAPVAAFSVDKSEGYVPLTVRVTDQSQKTDAATTTWLYTFESGSTSSSRNPSHTYTSPGTYRLSQLVTKSCVHSGSGVSRLVRTIKVNSAITTFTAVNLSGVSVSSPTTPVTASVTPAVTTIVPTTTASPAPVVPVYTGTPATGIVPVIPVTSAAQVTGTTQQAGTAGSSPSLSQVPGTPAAETPGTGTLSVTTNPVGAQVFVDDVMWGASPATVPRLSAGSHTLRLVHPGYQNMSVPVTITDGTTAEYTFTLVPESARSMGMPPAIAGVLAIMAVAGGAYLSMRKKGPGTGGQK
jgi:PKD repeat protein